MCGPDQAAFVTRKDTAGTVDMAGTVDLGDTVATLVAIPADTEAITRRPTNPITTPTRHQTITTRHRRTGRTTIQVRATTVVATTPVRDSSSTSGKEDLFGRALWSRDFVTPPPSLEKRGDSENQQ